MSESNGKSVIVAGVGHHEGVGAAVARKFACEGYRVVVFGRNEEKLKTALEGLRAIRPNAEAHTADVTDEDRVRQLVADADRDDAPLDAAIFNAGGNWPRPFADMDGEFLKSMWRVNALAGFYFAKAAIERMAPPAISRNQTEPDSPQTP